LIKVTCPYCAEPASLVKGDVIYPHLEQLHKRSYWYCPCVNAYVGCHKGSVNPLGRLANKSLRKLKMDAHQVFDPIWRGGFMSRREAYDWLAIKMDIPPDQTHIGMFDEEQCKRVIKGCKSYNLKNINKRKYKP